MESNCAVLFFDEIDALGQSRGDEGGGSTSSGGNHSSRRLLAELLIQMTRNFNGDSDDSSSGSDTDESDIEDECEVKGGLEDSEQADMSSYLPVPKEAAESPPALSIFGGVTAISTTDYGSKNQECSCCQEEAKVRNPQPISPVPPTSILTGKKNCNNTPHPRSSATAQCNLHVKSSASLNGIDKLQDKQSKPRVLIIAATNRPEDCDPALLRRFAVRVHVGLPPHRDRKRIVARLLSDIEHTITSNQLREIATATDSWSGSDLESLTREAAMAPIRECLRIAAVLRSKAKRCEQHSGAKSAQENQQRPSTAEDENAAAREKLLSGFRNLRSVTMEDFDNAISFLMGTEQIQEKTQVHYDSNSSSDEDVN